jgi:hypothetical protein
VSSNLARTEHESDLIVRFRADRTQISGSASFAMSVEAEDKPSIGKDVKSSKHNGARQKCTIVCTSTQKHVFTVVTS